jgi:hypothetical protein
VVALLDENQSAKKLWKFAIGMIVVLSLVWIAIVTSPLSMLWFKVISAIPSELAILAQTGIWITIPLPALAVLQSWYQGAILHSHRTKGITEAVVIYLIANITTLSIGVIIGKVTGLYIGLISFVISTVIQTLWLRYRSKGAISAVVHRDIIEISIPPAEIVS